MVLESRVLIGWDLMRLQIEGKFLFQIDWIFKSKFFKKNHIDFQIEKKNKSINCSKKIGFFNSLIFWTKKFWIKIVFLYAFVLKLFQIQIIVTVLNSIITVETHSVGYQHHARGH